MRHLPLLTLVAGYALAHIHPMPSLVGRPAARASAPTPAVQGAGAAFGVKRVNGVHDVELAAGANANAPAATEAAAAAPVHEANRRSGVAGRVHAARADKPIARALRSAVGIRVGKTYGAGVLVSADGYILTVHHVVEEARAQADGTTAMNVRVSIAGAPWQSAELVDADVAADLALLKVPEVPGNARASRPSSVLACTPGDAVFTIGSPANLSFSVAQGGVAFVGRRFGGHRYIQTDLPIQPGNSGGGLFDESGDLLGLVTFVVGDRPGPGFALPVEYAMARFPQLRVQREEARLADATSAFQEWSKAKIESSF